MNSMTDLDCVRSKIELQINHVTSTLTAYLRLLHGVSNPILECKIAYSSISVAICKNICGLTDTLLWINGVAVSTN
ncbi:hypothetical protein QVD17_16362 [Tagetes erecta]|uniref:Uncharacterized protein n=1 Tax=Tagetes erecta TaxID=13708 RepID=A0AAD8KQS1_TARER|nr:hypothetical protein QVD17_16362 [Tagetes erecta]